MGTLKGIGRLVGQVRSFGRAGDPASDSAQPDDRGRHDAGARVEHRRDGTPLLRFLFAEPHVAAALVSWPTVLVTAVGASSRLQSGLPHAAQILLPIGSREESAKLFARLGPVCACLILEDILQHGVDAREILAQSFACLREGGRLLVTVPHQFLYERKLQVPSRLKTRHKKFYSPGSLLAEVEEAIDPFGYRLRFMGDNDLDHNGAELAEPPSGGSDAVLLLERVTPPPWVGRLADEDRPVVTVMHPTQFPEPGLAPYMVLRPGSTAPHRILIVHLDHRGDFIMAKNAYRRLGERFPHSEITLVCGSWNLHEARLLGVAGEVLAFDFFPEDESAKVEVIAFTDRAESFRALLAGRQFDLAIDLRLLEDTRDLLKEVDAPRKAGFDAGEFFPWLDIRMHTFVPSRVSRAFQRFFAASQFSTWAQHRAFDIVVHPEHCEQRGAGSVIWGPYESLPPGSYDVTVRVDSDQPFRLVYDFAADSGKVLLGAGELRIRPGEDAIIALHLPAPAKEMEFRVYAVAGEPYPRFRFLGLQIVKRGSLFGLHQREQMTLLVELVALRSEHPSDIAVHDE